ncbi:enoyl-CoA hydratase/isomerase family protein [Cupriavidus basilensis]
MSVTLPRLVGEQQAALLLYTGRRVDGEEAMRIGLVDELVAQAEVRTARWRSRTSPAASAPLAVESTRETLRLGLADRIVEANQRELAIQRVQFAAAGFPRRRGGNWPSAARQSSGAAEGSVCSSRIPSAPVRSRVFAITST